MEHLMVRKSHSATTAIIVAATLFTIYEELYYKPSPAHADPLYILLNLKVRESGEYSCDDFALTTISHYWDAATVKLMKKHKVPFRMKRVPV